MSNTPLIDFSVFRTAIWTSLLLVLTTGCADEIQQYEVPAPAQRENVVFDSDVETAPRAAPTPSQVLQWTVPADWRPGREGAMRRASYAVGPEEAEADLSIIALAGVAGGLRANVNRWRQQINLDPLPSNRDPAEPLPGSPVGLQWIELHNPEHPESILGGVVSFQGESWFFKLMGPSETVETARAEFYDFLLSVHSAPSQP